MKANNILMGVIFLLIVIISGSLYFNLKQSESTHINTQKVDIDNIANKFSSQDELLSYINQSNLIRNYNSNVLEDSAVFAAAGGSARSSEVSGAEDFSGTNIQVEGVDEPDIVKNDGKYIYSVVGSKVVIVDAYPAKKMSILSEIDISDRVSDIFVNEDKLIIFNQDYLEYDSVDIKSSPSIYPYRRYSSKLITSVFIYDIEDRSNPILESEFSADGEYIDSRMIGDFVYLISSKNINPYRVELPVFVDNGVERVTSAEEIYYFDYPDNSFSFTSVMAIDIENGKYNNEVYLIGSSRSIFVSEKNIYLTNEKSIEYEEYNQRLVNEVYFKVLPEDKKNEVSRIMNSGDSIYIKMRNIKKLVEKYSESLIGNEKSRFDNALVVELEDFGEDIAKTSKKTVIHRIRIDDGNIDYRAIGEVPGHVLNQFSMGEHEDYFRIATTTGKITSDTSENHVYILNDNLEIVGSVEDLAKGEKIYSARFLGNRGYLVTFKKVDPFFVIDLENPKNPEVLGYLKIPGYSDYLHPYDENHIIGVGKETVEADDDLKNNRGIDFAWYQGLKISIFDVSDVNNPIESAKIIIGDRGTDSYALNDHKAFLLDKKRNLLVIPVDLAEINEEKYKGQIPDNAYGERIWQGAYVLNIKVDEISVKGRITHFEDNDDTGRYYGGKNIQRSLYMDEVLYTISESKIKANNIDDISEINSVDLPFKEEPVYYEDY